MIYNVYTDGSCDQGSASSATTNGGWAFIVTDEQNVILFTDSAFEPNTTNNRTEMLAIIKSVDSMSEKGFFNTEGNCLTINCDSAYIVNAFEDGWIDKWKKNGWKTKDNKPVKNQEFWQQLDPLNSSNIRWHWVEGHSGDPDNERCDAIARSYTAKYA